MVSICPACDGTRTSLSGDDGDRNIYEPCMYCDGEGEIEIVRDGRDEKENTDRATNGNGRSCDGDTERGGRGGTGKHALQRVSNSNDPSAMDPGKKGNFRELMDNVEAMARFSLQSGESVEDVTEAVFVHIFNSHGLDPELKEWPMSRRDSVMMKVLEDQKTENYFMNYIRYMVDEILEPSLSLLSDGEVELAKQKLIHGVEEARGVGAK